MPYCRTFLHKLVSSDTPRNALIIKRAFEMMKNHNLEMPIVMDYYGYTPLDIVLGVGDLSKDYSLFMNAWRYHRVTILKKQYKMIEASSRNTIMASHLLGYMKDYGILHYGPKLATAIIAAINLNVQNIEDYFENRCILSEHQPGEVQFDLKPEPFRFDETVYLKDDELEIIDLEYGVIDAKVWNKTERLKSNLFQNKGRKIKIQMFYLDMPMLHENTIIGH